MAPGYGVVGGSLPENGNIFEGDLTGMDEVALLQLTVLKCPTGYYGGGDSIAARCVKCPDYSTTKEQGSMTLADCSGRFWAAVGCMGWQQASDAEERIKVDTACLQDSGALPVVYACMCICYTSCRPRVRCHRTHAGGCPDTVCR